MVFSLFPMIVLSPMTDPWCWFINANMGYIGGIHGTAYMAAPWIRHGYYVIFYKYHQKFPSKNPMVTNDCSIMVGFPKFLLVTGTSMTPLSINTWTAM